MVQLLWADTAIRNGFASHSPRLKERSFCIIKFSNPLPDCQWLVGIPLLWFLCRLSGTQARRHHESAEDTAEELTTRSRANTELLGATLALFFFFKVSEGRICLDNGDRSLSPFSLLDMLQNVTNNKSGTIKPICKWQTVGSYILERGKRENSEQNNGKSTFCSTSLQFLQFIAVNSIFCSFHCSFAVYCRLQWIPGAIIRSSPRIVLAPGSF